MTRTEALSRLHGTWTHELRDGRVAVRDLSLLRAIEAIRRESEPDAPRTKPAAVGLRS